MAIGELAPSTILPCACELTNFDSGCSSQSITFATAYDSLGEEGVSSADSMHSIAG